MDGLLLAIVLAASPQAARSTPPPTVPSTFGLDEEVQRLDQGTGLRKARLSVSVRDERGRPVVDLRADEPMAPASNMKLLTTGAALATLGPDFSFQTRLLRNGDTLTVVGDGDPAFGDPELLESMVVSDGAGGTREGVKADELLDLWARAVKAEGMDRVRTLLVDDRIFAREFVPAGWPKDQLNERYCAEVCGLNFHLNRLHIWPRPGAQRPELARVEPAAPSLPIAVKATQKTGRKDENAVWISRSRDSNDLALNGNVKSAFSAPVPAVVHDMPSVFGEMLAARLRAAGVSVDAVPLAGESDPPPAGRPVGPVFRTPIATALQRANTDSENIYAECLLKRAAWTPGAPPVTWSAATAWLSGKVRVAIGDDAGSLVANDGSGLSRTNRVTADALTEWLHWVESQPSLSGPFMESLAVGGRTGTVRKRFRDLDPALATVQCKTGYVDGVSALSGFVTLADGRRWTFSVLGNGLSEPSAVAKTKQFQEQVVRAVARAMGTSRPRAGESALGGG